MFQRKSPLFELFGYQLRRAVTASFASMLVVSWLVLAPHALAQAAPKVEANHGSAEVSLPKLVAWKAPVVAGGLAPTIVLRVLVAADGTVKQAAVLHKRAALEEAEQRAIEAARGFRFQPGSRAGKPVEAWITLNLPLQPAPAGQREIVVKGSDTMGETLVPAWANALHRKRPELSIRVEALGSSTGFAGLLDGSADLAASSRLIKPDETAFASKLGVQLHEIFVGYDGISVIVHPDNPLKQLDVETLARIFAQRVSNWRELGGPDLPIHAIGRPSYSGTHAFFHDRVLSALGGDVGFGADIRKVEKNEDIVEAVSRDPAAIAYVGLAYVTPSVRALALKARPDTAATTPTAAAIYTASYPLARPLLLYMRTDAAHDTRAFVDFALSSAGQALLEQSGFVRMPTGFAGTFASKVPAPRVPAPELLRIYFEQNSTAITPESQLDLMQAARAIREDRRVLLIGNADSTGTTRNNRVLAAQRADAVAKRLRELSSRNAAKIETVVASTTHPLASNATGYGRQQNRRVDVIVLDAERSASDRSDQPPDNGARAPEPQANTTSKPPAPTRGSTVRAAATAAGI